MVKYGIQSMSQITAIKRPTEVPEYVQEKETTHTHTRTHAHTRTLAQCCNSLNSHRMAFAVHSNCLSATTVALRFLMRFHFALSLLCAHKTMKGHRVKKLARSTSPLPPTHTHTHTQTTLYVRLNGTPSTVGTVVSSTFPPGRLPLAILVVFVVFLLNVENLPPHQK